MQDSKFSDFEMKKSLCEARGRKYISQPRASLLASIDIDRQGLGFSLDDMRRPNRLTKMQDRGSVPGG